MSFYFNIFNNTKTMGGASCGKVTSCLHSEAADERRESRRNKKKGQKDNILPMEPLK